MAVHDADSEHGTSEKHDDIVSIDNEKQDSNHEEKRVSAASSHSFESEHSRDHNPSPEVMLEEPVTMGEPLGNVDTRSIRRTPSGVSATPSRSIIIVPRSKRRGLLGSVTLVPEVENPKDYKSSTKWGLVLIIALATCAAPLGSTVVYPALPVLVKDFHTSPTITNLSVALYMLSMAIFPLWWSSFSEQFGRRSIYVISFTLFLIFSILSAVSTNITMLIIFRMCAGGASASAHSTGAGSIADLFDVFERGRAMSIFYLGPLLGPLIAPVVGGALTQGFSWQATMWFLSIYGLVILLMIVFFLPETLARRPAQELPTASSDLEPTRTTESAKVKAKKFSKHLKRVLVDPLAVLLFLRFPPVLITVILAAIAFGSLYLGNIAIQDKFSVAPYNYGQLILGLLYIPSALGYVVASLVGGPWIDRIMAREARKANRYDEDGNLIYLPEDRLRENAWLATTLYPLALLMFGWTLNYGVYFIVPCIALFLFGFSSMLVFSAATTMLTEFIRKRSSAGVAVNNFVRNILSCIAAVAAAPWIKAIGVGWVMTTVCIFCLVVSYAGIITLRLKGTKWRAAMNEAVNKM